MLHSRQTKKGAAGGGRRVGAWPRQKQFD